jgi:hypothetical protein
MIGSRAGNNLGPFPTPLRLEGRNSLPTSQRALSATLQFGFEIIVFFDLTRKIAVDHVTRF